MRVKGANGLEFEVSDTVATGLIAAGIVEAIAEAEVEPEPEKATAKKGRTTRAK
ncbi:Uncharacterised protein [Chlamydia trachomatis]|nr:Uncharacterised protein [Chlamydia trachomatis]CRH89774.1 Uncharacterised protein [Chlamydia trachomatis]